MVAGVAVVMSAVRLFLIAAWVGVGVFVALYSAVGFFDFLWRGSVLFEGAVVIWVLLGAFFAWRVWR